MTLNKQVNLNVAFVTEMKNYEFIRVNNEYSRRK